MAKRTDIGDANDPNPDKDRQHPPAERTGGRIEGRSFAGEEFAAAQREQADQRNSGPPQRGNRTDDVQSSDREIRRGAGAEDGSDDDRSDVARRANAARTGLDAERRAESDENL